MIDTITAFWVLLTLGVVSGLRFNGDYWQWHTKAALDAEIAPEGKLARMHLAMEYAWQAWRMQRVS